MARTITLSIPERHHKLLQALGRLAIAHSNLEMVQIMCLKTLENLRPQEALAVHRRSGAGEIRNRIRNVVAEKGGAGESLLKTTLFNLLDDARSHGNRRNSMIHRFWGTDATGQWCTSGDESRWENLPSIAVIDNLVTSITNTMKALNKERFKGGYLFKLSRK